MQDIYTTGSGAPGAQRSPSYSRSAITFNTWRPLFSSAYSVSIAGRSAAETAELTYHTAYEWLNQIVAQMSRGHSIQIKSPRFGESFDASHINDDFREVHSASFHSQTSQTSLNIPQRAWYLGFKRRDAEEMGRVWRLGVGCKTIHPADRPEVILSLDVAFKDTIENLPAPRPLVPFLGHLRKSCPDTLLIKSGRSELPGAPVWVANDESLKALY